MSGDSTAVLVVDMQNGFCAEGGSLAGDRALCARYQALATPIRQLCASARTAGRRVIYTCHGYRTGYPEAGRELSTLHPEVIRANGMLWDSWDTQIIPGLAPEATDVVVKKSRFDAFLGTDLDLLLRAGDIRRLIIAGISTNVCVESTARSAAQRGYEVAVAADATAATTDTLHHAALANIAYAFATVAIWRDLL
ncbi:cysteine hydrolase family protein [Dactylosporangium sp. CA-233914]|uniref:cysteine hydrolase family protein n=1 Tax=Dactylosporangium sp. CA-233914 TaxID=3239934 RepID=UPI003D8DFB07